MDDWLTRVLVRFLRSIPQSNQDRTTLGALAGADSTDEVIGALAGCARMLALLGVVEFTAGEITGQSEIRASTQTAKYALESLASYLESGQTLVADWRKRGIKRLGSDDGGHILESGAAFLYLLEQRRRQIIPNPPPSRYVRVAQVIIKRQNPESGMPEILMQYDERAGQYQLIGGRWRESDGKDLKATAIREVAEELPKAALVPEKDYALQPVVEDLQPDVGLSPTFGALTSYAFWIYHMTDLHKAVPLQSIDQWVPIAQILEGYVMEVGGARREFTRPGLFRQLDDAIPGGLLGLRDSFAAD